MTNSKYLPFLLCFLLLTSCKLALLPPYSQELSTQIDNVNKSVDRFYLTMLENSTAATYPKFSDAYINIEVELTSLLRKNKLRPLNKESIRNCEIALKVWQEYKEDHKKKNILSEGIIKLNMQYMDDLFYAMQVTETAKK